MSTLQSLILSSVILISLNCSTPQSIVIKDCATIRHADQSGVESYLFICLDASARKNCEALDDKCYRDQLIHCISRTHYTLLLHEIFMLTCDEYPDAKLIRYDKR